MKRPVLFTILLFACIVNHVVAQKTVLPILSPVHANNVGKIVFSNSEIVDGKENQGDFIQSYKYGDPLFCKVFLESSLVAYVKKIDKVMAKSADTQKLFRLKISLDGAEKISYASLTPEQFSLEQLQAMNAFGDAIFQADLKARIADNRFLLRTFNDFWIQASEIATPGDHKVSIQLVASLKGEQSLVIGSPMAVGELTVKFPPVNANNPDICLPVAVLQNPELEERILRKYNEKAIDGNGTKVLLMAGDWEIIRNKTTSVIESRVMEVCIATRKDGKCFKSLRRSYQEDYIGGKFDPNTLHMRNIGDNYEIPCECLLPK